MSVGFVPVYRRRASALHAARAGIGAAYCGALALVAVLWEHPLILAADLCAVVAAGVAAGVGKDLRRAARIAVPIALLFALINPLVSQGGATLLVRGGTVLGRPFDVTLEAVVYGATAGLRVLVLIVIFAGLFSAAIDPDELLRLFRRVSYRSALTASLATRLVPVLARDAGRMGDAARCRPNPPGRGAVARAALNSALDRAVEVAAALEVRGYARARRPERRHAPWSRHDVRLATVAATLAFIAISLRVLGVGSFDPYPRLALALGPAEWALACTLVLVAVVPFAGTAGRLGVARA